MAKEPTALEQAIEEQIVFLQQQLAALQTVRLAEEAELDESDPMAPALRDPGFQRWLLERELQVRP